MVYVSSLLWRTHVAHAQGGCGDGFLAVDVRPLVSGEIHHDDD